MLSSFRKFFAVAPFLIFFFLPVSAERMMRPGTPGTNPPESPNPPHRHPLIRNSGYIFAGTVKSVERATPKGNGVATVVINFHVDQGIRGARTGQTLAIREWAGLWESGERYRPGERVLLFLYAPSKLGLTSPVAGPMGRFRIGSDGRIVVAPGRLGFPTRHPRAGNRFWGKTWFSPRDFVRFFRLMEEE
jgi:hypothetical protein